MVPIQEVNIYEFSEFDRQQALLFVSPIPALIQFERQKSKLDRLIGEFQKPQIPGEGLGLKLQKTVKKVRSTITSKTKNLLFGCTMILVLRNGGLSTLPRSQNLSTVERVLFSEPSDLPRFATPIDQPGTMPNQSNESVKMTESISSRVNYLKGPRKRAKLVRLSDLPPLEKQDSDLEIYFN